MITNRDLDMLLSLSEAGYLTAQGLDWLHFPRWPQWRAAQAGGTKARNEPLYRRLRYLSEHGYINRYVRTVDTGSATAGRAPDVFSLATEGAHILAERRGYALESLFYQRERLRSFNQLAHYAESGDFYAAMRAVALLESQKAMSGWLSEHRTAKAYDRVATRVKNAQGGTVVKKLPIQPDGTFALVRQQTYRMFVEIDRGTRRLDTWREKIAAYEAYAKSPELWTRYATDTFWVLVVCKTDHQRQRLIEATATMIGVPTSRYLFCLAADVHPLTIGTAWLKMETVTKERRVNMGKVIDYCSFTTSHHTLYRTKDDVKK